MQFLFSKKVKCLSFASTTPLGTKINFMKCVFFVPLSQSGYDHTTQCKLRNVTNRNPIAQNSMKIKIILSQYPACYQNKLGTQIEAVVRPTGIHLHQNKIQLTGLAVLTMSL